MSIEDVHMQIVAKHQRGRRLIGDIEGEESEALFARQGMRKGGTVLEYKQEQVLGSDGCTKPTIKLKKK